ncbi:hypothetical protein [Collinsella sp. AF38-3AC]|uniref:phage tail protein n=1 Tax=Collinsella sp. AF38-3AC TaxID=2292015 RepID=UPI000E4E5830|nr:hypothetical protein [Collinsella sp. AF38-3AC]RHL22108.1 hypothetical protein DW029_09405 [Collinsella sp. AF38-3AC]
MATKGATSVGSACITLMPSMDGFAGKICSEFGSTGSKAGKSFGDSMASGMDGGVKRSSGLLGGLGTVARGVGTVAAAGMGALTTAVTAIGGAALSAYADYEQLVGGVDTLFGSASGTLQGYAAEAYRTCGMSANQYMEQATSFAASLVSSCGGDVAKAAESANTAMGDMADNVNKMGSDMADVQNAYQGFAKQNYTMLDNLKLGYGGTKSEMERLIADANKLRAAQGKNADLTIDSYADVVEAIHTVQEEMGITGTTSNEAATTISGSIGMAKAAWENFLTGLGRDDVDFSVLTEQLLTSVGAVAKNIAPRVAQIGQGIIEAFPAALSGIASVLTPIVSEALATAWNIAVGALEGIGIKLPKVDSSQICSALQAILGVATSVGNGIRAAIEFIAPLIAPIGAALLNLAQTVLPVLSTGIQVVLGIVQALSPVIGFLVTAIADVVATVSQLVAIAMPAVQSVLSAVLAAMPLIQGAIQVAMGIISAVWDAVWPAIESVLTGVMTAISTAVQVAMAVVQAVITTVTAAINGDWDAVWNAIFDLAEVVWGKIKFTVTSAINQVNGVISSVLNGISSTWSSMWESIKSACSSIWEGIKSAASSGINSVYTTVTGIKDKIVGFFSGAGSWLVSSGKAILNGLKSGIESAIGSVTSAVSGAVSKIRSYFPFSPAKVGPFSGHGYTTFSGKALMQGWAQGIGSGTGSVASAISAAMDTAQTMLSTGLTVAPVASYAAASPEDGRGDALDGILAVLEQIRDKDGNVYIDSERLSSAMAMRGRHTLAGRGLA